MIELFLLLHHKKAGFKLLYKKRFANFFKFHLIYFYSAVLSFCYFFSRSFRKSLDSLLNKRNLKP